MSVISKVLTAALYRIGQTDLALKMQGKIHEAVLQAQQIADTFTIRNVGTQDNVEGIVKAFARDPETGETEHMRLVTQDWNDGQGSISHEVYDSIMYIGGEEVTV